MSGLVLPVSLLLYVILPMAFLVRGWPLRASLAMIATALLPWAVWFLTVPRPWGPGAGMVVMVTAGQLLLAAVPLAIGMVVAMRRGLRRRRPAI